MGHGVSWCVKFSSILGKWLSNLLQFQGTGVVELYITRCRPPPRKYSVPTVSIIILWHASHCAVVASSQLRLSIVVNPPTFLLTTECLLYDGERRWLKINQDFGITAPPRTEIRSMLLKIGHTVHKLENHSLLRKFCCVLRPVLFCLYTNELSHLLRRHGVDLK